MGVAELLRFDTEVEANACVLGMVEIDNKLKERLIIYKEDDGTYTVNID